jgi:hypothetical protein
MPTLILMLLGDVLRRCRVRRSCLMLRCRLCRVRLRRSLTLRRWLWLPRCLLLVSLRYVLG